MVMRNKKKTELEMEIALNDFICLSVDDFVKYYTPNQFKRLISLIPASFTFVQMMSSLLEDFIEAEEFLYCCPLRDKIKEYLD